MLGLGPCQWIRTMKISLWNVGIHYKIVILLGYIFFFFPRSHLSSFWSCRKADSFQFFLVMRETSAGIARILLQSWTRTILGNYPSSTTVPCGGWMKRQVSGSPLCREISQTMEVCLGVSFWPLERPLSWAGKQNCSIGMSNWHPSRLAAPSASG